MTSRLCLSSVSASLIVGVRVEADRHPPPLPRSDHLCLLRPDRERVRRRGLLALVQDAVDGVGGRRVVLVRGKGGHVASAVRSVKVKQFFTVQNEN